MQFGWIVAGPGSTWLGDVGIVRDEMEKEMSKEDEAFEKALAETTERHGGALKKLADK